MLPDIKLALMRFESSFADQVPSVHIARISKDHHQLSLWSLLYQTRLVSVAFQTFAFLFAGLLNHDTAMVI